MSYSDQLRQEIESVLDALAAERRSWNAAWITTAICSEHEAGLAADDGEDIEFWRYGGQTTCREMVRRCINRRAGEKPEPQETQFILPGFEHLQTYYVVKREGEDLGVSVFDLTAMEIKEKANVYRKMGAGCFAHADELLRFLAQRAASA